VNKLLALLAIVACAALGDARAAGLMCIGNDVVQFGNKLVGSYNTAHLTISNCGAQAWSFTGVGLHPATGPAFDVDSTCTTGLTLAPGAHCTVDVIFAPLETGQTSGGYRLQNTSATPNELVTFYGRGVDPRAGTATLAFEPASAQFPAQWVGTRSAPLPMLLRNLGPGPLTLSAAVFTGPAAYDFSRPSNACTLGTPIPAGEACAFSLSFLPQALGTRLANLVFDAPELASLAILQIHGVSTPVTIGNVGGIWWNESEPGWGVYFSHQGDTVFAIWFTYGVGDEPVWFVAVLQKSGTNTFSGTLTSVTGPPDDTQPFDRAKVVETPVGAMVLTLAGNDRGTLSYSIKGLSETRAISRMRFGSAVPTCAWGALADLANATNFQDLWWNAPAGSESGWGIGLTHQGDAIFATWFTYGPDGKPRWLIATASKSGPSTYTGPLSTATGSPYFIAPFDPSAVVETIVGDATFDFSDGNHATFTYTLDGVTHTKQITRQVFAPPGTDCQ